MIIDDLFFAILDGLAALWTWSIFPSSGAGKSSREMEQAAPRAASTASKASAPESATRAGSNFLGKPTSLTSHQVF